MSTAPKRRVFVALIPRWTPSTKRDVCLAVGYSGSAGVELHKLGDVPPNKQIEKFIELQPQPVSSLHVLWKDGGRRRAHVLEPHKPDFLSVVCRFQSVSIDGDIYEYSIAVTGDISPAPAQLEGKAATEIQSYPAPADPEEVS